MQDSDEKDKNKDLAESLIIGADVGSFSSDSVAKSSKKKKKKVKKPKTKVEDNINNSLSSLEAEDSRLSQSMAEISNT